MAEVCIPKPPALAVALFKLFPSAQAVPLNSSEFAVASGVFPPTYKAAAVVPTQVPEFFP